MLILLLCFVLQLWRVENATRALVTPVFGNVFPRNNFVIFHRRSKGLPFLKSVNYSTNDTAEAVAVSFNILLVEFSRTTFLHISTSHYCKDTAHVFDQTFEAICMQKKAKFTILH